MNKVRPSRRDLLGGLFVPKLLLTAPSAPGCSPGRWSPFSGEGVHPRDPQGTCYISVFFLFRWAGCICGSGYLYSFSCACSSCSAAPLALPAPAPVAAPAPAPVPTPGPAPAPAAGLSHKRNYAWKAPGGSKQFAGPADQRRARTAPARERKARPAGAKKKRRASCTEPWKRKTASGLV